ncbi:putative T6SS immunity periplasmic lipoprotein [Erwinia sp. E_sp_B04_7]|uniref:putative T6SS immunity periplasmic lipoprotein n=1 Tax=unclassified Erwinia TaxID=2622719 RepID=UPI0030D593ED
MVRKLSIMLLLCGCLMMLTGCPGPGDRMVPDETSLATWKGDKVCVEIKDAQDYQPVAIAINLRGTPSKEKNITSLLISSC